MRITIADVARQAGVNKSTVSRALKDDPGLNIETRSRLKALAEQLGYVPDPALSRIASYRWKSGSRTSGETIAFIDFSAKGKSRVLEYRSLSEQASQAGYLTELFALADYPSLRALGKMLYARGITSVVFGPQSEPIAWEEFPWQHFSALNCMPGIFSAPLHGVTEDYFQAILLCDRTIRQKGYKKIGYALLRHDYDSADDTLRYAAACHVLSLAQRACRVPPYVGSFQDIQGCLIWFEKYRPEVVVGFNHLIPIWLREAKYECPADYAFATLSAGSKHKYAGIECGAKAVGRAAFFLADSLLRHHQLGMPEGWLRKILIEPNWRDGESCP